MKSPMHSSSRREPVRRASIAERRRPAARPEHYDSELLPVLLRLPDVYGTREVPTVPPDRPSDAGPPRGATGDTAPAPTPVLGAEATPPSSTCARAATPRTLRGGRRRAAADDATGWLPGVRRFMFAVLMAAVLLAVIITIEQWNRPAAPSRAPVLPKQSAAAAPDAGLPELAPAANATWSPPGIPDDTARHSVPAADVTPASAPGADTPWSARVESVPSGLGWADAGEPPANTPPPAARTANAAPVAPGATGYADGVDVSAVQYDYPSTGRTPVSPELPVPAAASPPPRWPLPAEQPALHSADRHVPGWSFPTR